MGKRKQSTASVLAKDGKNALIVRGDGKEWEISQKLVNIAACCDQDLLRSSSIYGYFKDLGVRQLSI